MWLKGDDAWGLNDRSAVMRLQFGQRTALFCADAENRLQRRLAEVIPPEKLDVDIFKYPHHGVRPAGWNFLEHMSPELAVITNTRSRVKDARKDAEKRGFATLFTAEGLVRLRTDGHIWVVDQMEINVE